MFAVMRPAIAFEQEKKINKAMNIILLKNNIGHLPHNTLLSAQFPG
jgi:hypothetical protein